MGGANNYQVVGMMGLKINQRQRHQVSLRAKTWDVWRKEKSIVQVSGRCFGKSDFVPSQFSRTLSA